MEHQLQLLLASASLLFSHKGEEEVISFCGKRRKTNNLLPLLQTHSSSHTPEDPKPNKQKPQRKSTLKKINKHEIP